MADIFISYASEDRARVRPLAEALQQRGFNIWWDRSLAAGQDYTSIIEKELKNSKAVIVVWTQSSAMSTFVRDEAGRARDEGRLVPVMLDQVPIPLGFGSFQAEDFTKWNGGSNAPQMQLLEESLKARLEGRDIDGAAVARKRRKLMSRIRIVSLLTVVALVIGIAAFGKYIFFPDEPEVVQTDLRAELLRLLEEGKLTPEQAIQLAQILEAGALGESQQMASNEAPDAASPAPSAGTMVEDGARVEMASVSEAEFDQASRETYQTAVTALLTHSDAGVRTAAVQLSDPALRDAAMQTLWTYAQNHPDDPQREQIYMVCGAVGERNDNPLGQAALEQATNLAPTSTPVWRMLSRSYRRTNQAAEAQATALVGAAVQQQAEGQTEAAEQNLQQALPNIEAPALRASVASQLGQLAEQRSDDSAASARFAEAYRLREQAAAAAPDSSPAAEALEADAQQLVRALNRSGRTREACERLRQAQESHDVAAPDQETLTTCETTLRTDLAPRVALSPQLRESDLQRSQIQRAPLQRVAPTP